MCDCSAPTGAKACRCLDRRCSISSETVRGGTGMRLLLATMSHETNTFSPVPTKLDRFCRNGDTLLSGEAAIDFYRGTGTCMGGYLAVAEEAGAEVVVPVCAAAPPSGPVDRAAYETMCGLITDV